MDYKSIVGLQHALFSSCQYQVQLSSTLIFHPFFLVAPAFHEVSVYPKKELPFFILFTAGLCSFCAMLAMLTHQFPELMGVFVKAVSTCTPHHTSQRFICFLLELFV